MTSWMTQRNGPAFSRPRRAAVVGATLLVVALGTSAVWSLSPAPPPPAQASDSRTAAADEAQATTGEVAPREVPARSEAATPRTAVVGRALDAGGGPLAGFRVTLHRTDPGPVRIRPLEIPLERLRTPYSPVSTEIDAAGGFAFESLDAGNYLCYVVGMEWAAETFALAAGEVRELTLQSQFVALTGTLFRRGEIVKDCFVDFEEGNKTRHLYPGETGVMRLFAAPGRYKVIVLQPGSHGSRSRSPCLSRHDLLVPEGVPALQWRFDTGGTEIAFAVEGPDGRAIDTYKVDIEGVGVLEEEPIHYELRGTRIKPAAMGVVPAGRWRATVTSDGFRVEPRDFTTGFADDRVVLSFAALPAASVRLQLRSPSQFLTTPDARHMPALIANGCEVPCTSVARPPGGRAPAYDYSAVPPGKATLRFEDRIDGDELVPLPFDPVAPVTIDVAIGCANEVAVDVVPRAFVDLRGCDESGMERSSVMVTVWVDGHRVRNRDGKVSQRWLGWLPRGVHRVVIDRNGTCREHVLQVDRTQVRERYRP